LLAVYGTSVRPAYPKITHNGSLARERQTSHHFDAFDATRTATVHFLSVTTPNIHPQLDQRSTQAEMAPNFNDE